MKTTITLALAAALLGGVFAGTAEARDRVPDRPHSACLQNSRIYSWDVVDSRTLKVRDINGRPFTVELRGGCVGLTKATLRLAFRSNTSLGCLESGDRISYSAPALGRMSCTVRAVHPDFGPRAENDRR